MIPAIKICGVTSLADAETAIACGASYIGLIFAESSPRKVDQSSAQQIAQAVKGRVKVVGVFKDADEKVVENVYSSVGLDLVQYHGSESPAFIRSLALPSMKAFEIDKGFAWDKVRAYEGLLEMILLDRPKSGFSADWLTQAIAVTATKPDDTPPCIFAGGLTPENVRSVISHLSGRIHGVDVASGVEKEPGVKDISKVEQFCKVVKEEAMRCAH